MTFVGGNRCAYVKCCPSRKQCGVFRTSKTNINRSSANSVLCDVYFRWFSLVDCFVLLTNFLAKKKTIKHLLVFKVTFLKITEWGTAIDTNAPFPLPCGSFARGPHYRSSGVFPRPQFIYFCCLFVSTERNNTGRLHTFLYLIVFGPIE